MKKLKIGIAGCGAIGTSLAKAIVRDFKRSAALTALFDTDFRKSKVLSSTVSKKKNLAVAGLRQLIDKSDLVIEASSAKSSLNLARSVLSRGRSVMVMSVGGIIDSMPGIVRLAAKSGAKVYVPSGAIAGIDALKAAKLSKIRRVTLTTRKHPSSFKGVQYLKSRAIKLEKIKKDTVLFSGSAKEAVRFFPQNINVAATLSIAGIGANNTRVRIVASPGTKKNVHEVEVESDAAKILTRTENILHPQNPKTSYLAVLSAIATLRRVLEPLNLGT